MRRLPSPRHLARRRFADHPDEVLLPALALALLASIALWPEFDRTKQQAMQRLPACRQRDRGRAVDRRALPRRRREGPAVHAHRATAQQVEPERVDLTIPKGDITLENGTWLMLQAKQGVFMQHSNLLDLSHDVTLYRDDGTTLVTASASIDLKNGAAAGAEPVHAEGPFGTLDAQGFT